MNYGDDELERMRARREQRKTGGRGYDSRSTKSGSGESSFKSGYRGPKSGSGGRMSEQRPPARKRKGPDKKKRVMIIAAEVLVIVILLCVAAGWYVYERTFGSLQVIEFDEQDVQNVNLTDDQLEGMKGYMTVACFGVDSRSVGGKQNVGKGTNADVNLICSVNMETGEIRLVSVFRDTYLNISDKNSYNKINAAYASGGPEQAVKALNKNLGLNITQYATFNWKAVADAINILDGVDIEISENEFSWINAYITETVKESGVPSEQLKHAGLVHMDGVQAVAYGRLRLGDTDYARTERQRIVMEKAFEKAKSADWATLNNVIQTVMPQLATNVKPLDLIPLARNISKYHIGDTSGFPSARGETTVGKLGDCVIPQTLESNVKDLHKFLFDVDDYQVPSNVKEYSKHIADASGMYKEGKPIGHVPVDQGVSARSYINRKQQKAQQKAAATEAPGTTEESSTDESSESSTDESGTDESSTESGAESSTWDDEWGDEWDDWDDEWNEGPGSYGPGGGPGSSTKPSQSNNRPGNKTTASDENNNATGPGMTPTSPTESRGGSSTQRPGTTPTTGAEPSKAAPITPDTPTTAASNGKPEVPTEEANGPALGPGA